MKKSLFPQLALIPLLLIYAFQAYSFNFIQDDAYITYRYVVNFLNGDGLVYNIGERIEGFTNFGWTILLCLLGAIKLDFIFWSQVIGFFCGAGIIVFTFYISRELIGKLSPYIALLPALLVAVNISLAYWAPAGLETAAFALLVAWSFFLFLKRNYLLIAALALIVWVRPDGAVVAGALILAEAIAYKRIPLFTLRSTVVALIVSLPFVFFKLIYYGSILPNPFYAKTGLNYEVVLSGLEYAWRFMSHYGFYGLPLVLIAVVYKRLSTKVRAALIFVLLFIIYIVLVGGDVLKAHRFFLPLFSLYAILTVTSVYTLLDKLKRQTTYLLLFITTMLCVILTIALPRSFVTNYNELELYFVKKMAVQADLLKKTDSRNFSVAITTIGRFGYELIGHKIIDMLGLTDSTIARHPEKPIEGMETTWKERRHNTTYLLTQAPDYFMFSTGLKPSAPAERALLLYPAFMNSYRATGWISPITNRTTLYAFKKVKEVEDLAAPLYPVEYVTQYKEGLDFYVKGDHRAAIESYNQALRVSPRPYYLYLMYNKAFSVLQLKQYEIGGNMLDAVLAQDSLVFEAHRDLYLLALVKGDLVKARIHARWLKKLIPWDYDRILNDFDDQIRKLGQQPPPRPDIR